MASKVKKLYFTCVRKVRYSTLRSANDAAAKMTFRHPEERKYFTAYKCEHCSLFHVGRVKAGKALNYPDGWERSITDAERRRKAVPRG
jgi:hypothetical protein